MDESALDEFLNHYYEHQWTDRVFEALEYIASREESLSAFSGFQLSVCRDEIEGQVSIEVCLVHPDPGYDPARELALYEAPFPVSDAEFSTRLQEARTFLQEACRRLKVPKLKDRDELKWSRYSTAALVAAGRGDFENAVNQNRLALEEAEALGEHDSLLSLTLRRLAYNYQRWGSTNPNDRDAYYDQAEPLYQRALAIDEKIFGPEHPGLGLELKDLAELYYARGSYVKAEPLYQRALAIMEKTLGPEHRDLAPILNGLADVYLLRHKYKEAEPLYKRALTFEEKKLIKLLADHQALIVLLEKYAVVLRNLKRTEEAGKFEVRVRKLRAKHPGK